MRRLALLLALLLLASPALADVNARNGATINADTDINGSTAAHSGFNGATVASGGAPNVFTSTVASLDGGEYIYNSYTMAAAVSDTWSICGWIRFTSLPTSGQTCTLIDARYGGSGNYRLIYLSGTTGRMGTYVSNEGDTVGLLRDWTESYSTATRYFVCLVKNATTSVTLYRDGVAQTQGSSGGSIPTQTSTSVNATYGWNRDVDTCNAHFGPFGWWSVALSTSEQAVLLAGGYDMDWLTTSGAYVSQASLVHYNRFCKVATSDAAAFNDTGSNGSFDFTENVGVTTADCVTE